MRYYVFLYLFYTYIVIVELIFVVVLALFLDPWCLQEYQARESQIKYCNWSPLGSDFFTDLRSKQLIWGADSQL